MTEEIEEKTEEDAKEHILHVLTDILEEIASCPNNIDDNGVEEWDCNKCKDFPKHFRFMCESVAVLCGIFQNLIMSNPEVELEDMREDPLENIEKEITKRLPEGSLYL